MKINQQSNKKKPNTKPKQATNKPNQCYYPFICIIPSSGVDGRICVILSSVQKNCCLCNSKYVCCGDIAQLLGFNCFLRKEKKKGTEIFLTDRLVQTFVQNNAAFFQYSAMLLLMALVVVILVTLSPLQSSA